MLRTLTTAFAAERKFYYQWQKM